MPCQARQLQPCLGIRQGVVREPGEQLNVGEVLERPGEIVGLPGLASDLGRVADELQALRQSASVGEQHPLGAHGVALHVARSGAAREIERGLDRGQSLADPLAEHMELGVAGHHDGLGRRRRAVGEQTDRPLECLRARRRLTRCPRAEPDLQVGQRHPLDVRRAGQLRDRRHGQVLRPHRLARREPGFRGLLQQRGPVRTVRMALRRGLLPQRQGGLEMIGSLSRRPHPARPPGCSCRRLQGPDPVVGRFPVQGQHAPPCARGIDDRIVRLDRRGGGEVETMALRGQQVVVDRLAHEIVPEPQLTRGSPEDVVIDGLAQRVLDLG